MLHGQNRALKGMVKQPGANPLPCPEEHFEHLP